MNLLCIFFGHTWEGHYPCEDGEIAQCTRCYKLEVLIGEK